jgi:hypothetical protein
MLTNAAVWSADSQWIVYDTRSGVDGAVFEGTRIERVEVATGTIERLYESRDGACCGVVTASPTDDRVVFILGPERPTPDWQYGPSRRQGVIVHAGQPGVAENLDARDLVPAFTPGALRGGSHVHLFSGDGRLVSFTYEDAVLDLAAGTAGAERNLRGIGVSVCDQPVKVPAAHPRNHDGSAFTVLVTRLHDAPRPGSDEISKAFEEGWIGRAGYLRAGRRQRDDCRGGDGRVVPAHTPPRRRKRSTPRGRRLLPRRPVDRLHAAGRRRWRTAQSDLRRARWWVTQIAAFANSGMTWSC